jgi:hypothetical protein
VNKGKRKGRGDQAPASISPRKRGAQQTSLVLPQSEEVTGPGNVLEASVGYLTLQFFGFGSPIRNPSSVVFVGMMCVA